MGEVTGQRIFQLERLAWGGEGIHPKLRGFWSTAPSAWHSFWLRGSNVLRETQVEGLTVPSFSQAPGSHPHLWGLTFTFLFPLRPSLSPSPALKESLRGLEMGEPRSEVKTVLDTLPLGLSCRPLPSDSAVFCPTRAGSETWGHSSTCVL